MDTYSGRSPSFERRRNPRINKPFRIKIRGTSVKGEAFEVATAVVNLSSGGLYLNLEQEVAEGADLIMEIRLSTTEIDELPVAVVAARGVVIRVEPPVENKFGVAVAIKKRSIR